MSFNNPQKNTSKDAIIGLFEGLLIGGIIDLSTEGIFRATGLKNIFQHPTGYNYLLLGACLLIFGSIDACIKAKSDDSMLQHTCHKILG